MRNSHNGSEQGGSRAGIVDRKVARLIAAGAAIASNNDSAFTKVIEGLQADGTPEDEIRLAVQMGQTAKDKPAGMMKTLADTLTGTRLSSVAAPVRCPADKVTDASVHAIMMLIAAGSAMAANCEPCLNKAIPELIEAGVAREDIGRALEIGQSVKDQKASEMIEVAEILSDTELSEQFATASNAAADCVPGGECACT